MQTRQLTREKTNMKTIQKTSIYLPMAAMLLIAAFTGSAAAADKQLPRPSDSGFRMAWFAC